MTKVPAAAASHTTAVQKMHNCAIYPALRIRLYAALSLNHVVVSVSLLQLVHGRVYCEKLGGWKRLVTYGNLQKLHLNIHVWERMEAGSENGTPRLTGELAALHG